MRFIPRSLSVTEVTDTNGNTDRSYTRKTGEAVATASVIPNRSDYGYSHIVRLGNSSQQSLAAVLQAEGIVGSVKKRAGRLFYHPFSTDCANDHDYDVPIPCAIDSRSDGTLRAVPL